MKMRPYTALDSEDENETRDAPYAVSIVQSTWTARPKHRKPEYSE